MSECGYFDQITDSEIRKRWKFILDQASSVSRDHCAKVTPFLSPGEWSYTDLLMSQYSDLNWSLVGGYEFAERKRLLMMPDYFQNDQIDSVIAILLVKHSEKNRTLSHRDYLGAFLSLGIRRDVIGDICIIDQSAYIMVTPDMKDYITWNLNSVGSAKVTVEEVDHLPKHTKLEDMDITKGTVASLRLDAILSLALKISRSNAQSMISGKKISLNWQMVNKHNTIVEEKDTISIFGYGRLKLLEIGNMSRSKRWHVRIGKMK